MERRPEVFNLAVYCNESVELINVLSMYMFPAVVKSPCRIVCRPVLHRTHFTLSLAGGM
jgi:hypothetical protein